MNFLTNQETLNHKDFRLFKGNSGDSYLHSLHREWYINQAVMSELALKVEQSIKKQLEHNILHSYSKVSTSSEEEYEFLRIQTTPLFLEECGYHRVTRNELLTKIYEEYSRILKIEIHEIFLLDNFFFKEVIDRELFLTNTNLEIESKEAFEKTVDDLLLKKNKKFPKHILIDFSKYLNVKSIEPKEIKNTIVPEFENILLRKFENFLKENPKIKKEEVIEDLFSKLHLIAFIKYEDQSLLLLPEFLMNNKTFELSKGRHGYIYRLLDDMMSRTGFRMDPAQAKEAWLKIQDIKTICKNLKIPCVEFAKPFENWSISTNFQEFMEMPIVNKFRNLSHEKNTSPYLEVLPEATWRLLDGLSKYEERGGIHSVFQQKGIESLIQVSYFRMMNAMNEAIFRKDNQIAFYNQIELIHQEIQTILSIVQPYDNQDLAKAVMNNMSSGQEPVFSSDLPSPHVYVKASAMHGLSSILASVETQKGNHNIHLAIAKDSYYFKANETLKQAQAYELSIIDSDHFEKGGIEKAFENPSDKPIDLFVTEFHHNILENRQIYYPEKVLMQVKNIIEKGLASENFTVVIDTTIALEDDLQTFLKDSLIKDQINKGNLNVVFLRSAQKFDMLGMDNYYGGIIISVNTNFEQFNKRMADPDDQLKGLSYQGLAHLLKYASHNVETFKKMIMSNTQKLYSMLSKEMIYRKNTKNPLQISKIRDSKLFFLDIKFPHYPETSKTFLTILRNFAKEKYLFFTTRPSFSFMNTNLTVIDGTKIRLSIGLEDEKSLRLYAGFFKSIQKIIRLHAKMKNETFIQHDKRLSDYIFRMNFS